MIGLLYIVVSIGAFLVTALPTYATHPDYFTFLAVYTSRDLGCGIMYNLTVALALFLFKFVEAVVFGGTKEDEVEKLYLRVKIRLIGVMVITLVYNKVFTMAMFLGLVVFVLAYSFHQLLCLRSEYVVRLVNQLFRSHHPFIGDYFKVSVMFALTLFLDYKISSNTKYNRYSKNELPSKLAFGLQCMLAASLSSFVSLFVCSYERFTHCEFPRFHIYWFRIKYLLEIVSLSFMAWNWGMQLPESKELSITLLQLFDIFSYLSECKHRYQKAKDLNEEMSKLKWITAERLRQLHDSICTICFRDIEEGRQLGCKHVFHDDCLKLWLENRKTRTCPKCKQPFDVRSSHQASETKQGKDQVKVESNSKPKANIHTLKRQEEQNQQQAKENIFSPVPVMIPQQGQQTQQAHKRIQNRKQSEKISKQVPLIKPQQVHFTGKAVQIEFSPQSSQKQGMKYETSKINIIDSEIDKLSLETKLKIGSLPHRLPTEAVYRRTKEHFELRNTISEKEVLKKMFTGGLLTNRSNLFELNS